MITPTPQDNARCLGAVQRLRQSRERMARWLAAEDAWTARHGDLPGPASTHAGRGSLPWLDVALGLLVPDWRRHPVRALAQTAGMLGGLAVPPLIRRHPVAAVAGAASAGALLVACRPWRLLGRRSVWAALTTRMLTQLAWQALAQRAVARTSEYEATSPVP
jgi:hypothetical protein